MWCGLEAMGNKSNRAIFYLGVTKLDLPLSQQAQDESVNDRDQRHMVAS